jgi:ABC-type glycerol-3-phosphate transport system permease component
VTLEEAAAIDGAGPLRVFFEIMVPLARPGIVATAVFVLIVTWQEFLFALSFTSTQDMRTLPGGRQRLHRPVRHPLRRTDGELVRLISLPVIAVFLILQRQFVAGLTAGAVKG